jgi:hypothetical protein
MFLVLFASRQKEQAQRSVKHLTEHICIAGERQRTKSKTKCELTDALPIFLTVKSPT